MEYIVKRSIRERCLNNTAKAYLTGVLSKAATLIKQKKLEYKVKWRSYYESKFVSNELLYPKVKNWWKTPGAKREYNLIDNYKIVTPYDSNPKVINSDKA